MSVTVEIFEREVLKELNNRNLAVFAGAGLSRGSGYVDWKGLLRTIAGDMGLDVDIETDLVAVAQYYLNEHGRQNINQAILEEFTKEAEVNENVSILSRLPIDTYWTTNYDTLIEDTLKSNNKKTDVKRHQNNLKNFTPNRDAVIYKMHGDISDPDNAVITRDDYEQYNSNRQLFTINLQGELVAKTFIFIGFSFEDPNLEQILSRIRVMLLAKGNRKHYCFFRKVNREDYNTDEENEFKYAEIKQELRIKDLKRYGIEVVLVDKYSEITDILLKIEHKYKLSSVFISGSATEYGDIGQDLAIELMHNLSKELVKNDFKVISGFGLGVGSYIINGALEEIYSSKYKHVDEYIELRPFPQFKSGEKELFQLWQEYREDMIKDAGVAIFLFGNKSDGGKLIIANGVITEFAIAESQGKAIIPIGSTGYATYEVFKEVKKNIDDKYWYLKESIDILESERESSKLITEIIKIINRIRRV
jgi:hypothetical protein